MSEENGGDAAVAATAAGVADAIRFEIKEFSEGSESATTDEEHPSATGPPQSTSGHSRSVSETQNEGALNATAEEKSSRGNQTPGAKKGGRRVSGHRAMLSWSGLTGIGKSRPEIGDLVEAEWQGSGSWYVGYVEGKASVDGSSRRSKGVYHVVFADGDKADVHGRDLKQLGSSGVCLCICYRDKKSVTHPPVVVVVSARLPNEFPGVQSSGSMLYRFRNTRMEKRAAVSRYEKREGKAVGRYALAQFLREYASLQYHLAV